MSDTKLVLGILFIMLTIASSLDELCKQDLVTGPCRAAHRRFGYSIKEKKCTMFIYGGCQGNDNNFGTEEECRKKCS